MKTILEYLQSGHINTAKDDNAYNIIEKDGIQCVEIGKKNNLTYYLSLPSINAHKLQTRGDTKWLPVLMHGTAANELDCPQGWCLPTFAMAEDFIVPFIQTLNTETLNELFCANMDYLTSLPYAKLPLLFKNTNTVNSKIEIDIKHPEFSKIMRLSETEHNLWVCYIKIEAK